VFEAILAKGPLGDVAIDDFTVFDGPCYVTAATPETLTSPPSNMTASVNDVLGTDDSGL